MPLILSKLKGGNFFQLHCSCSHRLFVVLLPFAFSTFPSPLTVTWLKLGSYFVSTVHRHPSQNPSPHLEIFFIVLWLKLYNYEKNFLEVNNDVESSS
jgi:hypothetical protein